MVKVELIDCGKSVGLINLELIIDGDDRMIERVMMIERDS